MILADFCTGVGAILGGATAFVCFVSCCRWRRPVGWAIGLAALIALAWSASAAWHCIRCDGRRLAVAIYGVPMLWVGVLGTFGCRMALANDE